MRSWELFEKLNFFAHKNNSFIENSQLICSKGDLVSRQHRAEKMDLVETCTQERGNITMAF